MSPKTALDIVFGAMTFGKEGEEQVSTSDLTKCAAILDIFQKYGHNEVDTARFYGGGTSEEYLAQLKWKERGIIMDTKLFPNVHGIMGRPVTHNDEKGMRAGLTESLKALDTDSVDMWYLHGPDRSVPIEETLRVLNEFYKEGRFKRWGVSNYTAWEVAQICEICKKEGYPLPAAYQGVYNAFHRTIENELIHCLRKYPISFYAFNPLAGGYLTSRYHRNTSDSEVEPGSRFDPKRHQGRMYRARYWNDAFFDGLEILRPVCEKYGLRESEVALRWMMHHSQLKKEFGDKVIIGASSEAQLEMNMKDFEGGELDGEVLEALDRAWEGCRGVTWMYFHGFGATLMAKATGTPPKS